MTETTDPSRRRFLAGTAASLVAGPAVFASATRSRLSVAERAKSKLRFGMVTYLWGRDLPLPALIEACERAGLDGVELRTTHGHAVERGLDEAARRAVRDRFEASPVEIVGLGSDERFDSPDPGRLAAAKRSTLEFLELSAAIGGGGVKVKPDSFHRGVDPDRTIEQIGRSLAELGPAASNLGQELRLEVHGQCADPAVIRRIIEIADHPAVRVCWNSNPRDLRGRGFVRHYEMLRPHFGGTVHVRELGDERYPSADLIRRLVDDEYPGMVLLEAHTPPPRHLVSALGNQQAMATAMTADRRYEVDEPAGPIRIAPRRRAPNMLDVRSGDELIATLRLGSAERTPTVFPLNAPGERLAIRGFPFARNAGEATDHPHHRGLWFAHGDVDGHDFWHDPKCRVRVREHAVENDAVRFVADWIREGRPIATETRRMRFTATPRRHRIEVDIELAPVGASMTLGDTKEGAFAVRLAPTMRVDGPVALGRLENADGLLDGDCWGRRSDWVMAEGPIDGRLVRVRIEDADRNPRHPTWWHARKYGLLAANPFGRRAFEGGGESGAMTVTREAPLRLAYVVTLETGTAPGPSRT